MRTAARDFWVDWTKVADDMVGHLQAAAGVESHDRRLTEIVGELSTRSDEFRVLWARRAKRRERKADWPARFGSWRAARRG